MGLDKQSRAKKRAVLQQYGKSIIDPTPYSVTCAAQTHRAASLNEAMAIARKLVEDWAEVGIRRTAKVTYRDGSPVGEVSYSDLVTP